MYKVHLRRALLFMVVGIIAGYLLAKRQPEIYEARTEVQISALQARQDNTIPEDIRRLLQSVTAIGIDSEAGVLKSQGIFIRALERVANQTSNPALATPDTFRRLYTMYDVIVPASSNQYQPDVSKVLTIRVRAESKETAAAIANAVAYVYNETREQGAKEVLQTIVRSLDNQVTTAKAELERAENRYQDYKTQNNIGELAVEVQSEVGERSALQAQLATARAQLQAARAQRANLTAQVAAIPKNRQEQSTSVTVSPTVLALQTELARLEAERINLLQTYLEDAPEVQRANEAIQSTKKRMAAYKPSVMTPNATTSSPDSLLRELQNRLSVATSSEQEIAGQIASLETSLAQRQTKIARVPVDEKELARLNRDREIRSLRYTELKTLAETYRTQLDTGSARPGTVIGRADPATIGAPVAPDPEKWAAFAGIAGAALGLLYSFAVESFRQPVHTSWQLAELTSLPIAAAVPILPGGLMRRRLAGLRRGGYKPIESFRFMAFSLLARQANVRTIMFTGAGSRVGASAAAAEFAVALAQTGVRTLLVDCDLQNPETTRLFGLEGKPGVSDILSADMLPSEESDPATGTAHENLSILPAGTKIGASLSEFVTTHLSAFVEDMRSKADVVVLDLPPCTEYADAARVASYMDETCLVVSAKYTSFRTIPVAQEILAKAGAKDVSIVLTHASPTEEPFAPKTRDLVVRA